ncbi:hypothetical protein BsWGS_16783 [Bradybaena similaris]
MDPALDGAEDTRNVNIPDIAASVEQEANERGVGSAGLHEVEEKPVQNDAGQGTDSRASRKRKLSSVDESSGVSGGSGDENHSKPFKKLANGGRDSKGQEKNNKAQPESGEQEEGDEEEEEEDEIGVGAASGDNAVVNSNVVIIGQYLIEKSDMTRLENYPIWRMEGPNMLRKFEMIVQDGVVRHKSLNAYASWAQFMQDLYEKIQVRQISSQDGEIIVEVNPECVPRPQEMTSLEDKYMGDELVQAYNLYVEAMFQQAMDSSFLKEIKTDSESDYVHAINRIDTAIKEKITDIENEVSMKDEFKTRARNCPNMKSIRRQNWSQTDQATTNKSTEKGVCSVMMFGYGYDPFLMEEDKTKGAEVVQEVVIGSTMEQYLVAYHGLIHFKYTLLRRCQDKVKLINALEPGDKADVLVKCLHDRCWILQTFDHLKRLLANDHI